MTKLQCTIKTVTYHNAETGFSILKATSPVYSLPFTVKGNFPNIAEGVTIEIFGEFTTHPKYGPQFNTNSWQPVIPKTADGILAFLGSGIIKGIGPHTARLIVNHYGEKSLDIINNDIDQLEKIKGIGKKRVKLIKEKWQETKEIQDVMVFLQGHNISTAYATKIYKAYGHNSIRIVQANPYKLAEDISGIGFLIADRIAFQLGIPKGSPFRTEAGIIYALSQLESDGHMYGLPDQIIEKSVEILARPEEEINNILHSMCGQQAKIKNDNGRIYLPYNYRYETETCNDICRVIKGHHKNIKTDIPAIEKITGMQYDDTQRQAIELAANSKLMVITGGPGTGKTTTLKAIVTMFKKNKSEILLAAPTGKAAKRMTESIGLQAKTIHRMLEYKEGHFTFNRDVPLKGDLLIVDESSMIDNQLAYYLFQAIPDNMRVILVGDIDQLPSVGAGNVLRDIMKSNRVPYISLKTIHRQALQSDIITNAHRINNGTMPFTKNDKDYIFIKTDDPAKAQSMILEIIGKKIANKGFSAKDVQVLSPMKRSLVGTEALNESIRNLLNPHGQSIAAGDRTFRVGDKVMQIKNNYDKNVFNGDSGTIVGTRTVADNNGTPYKVVDVLIDGITVTYKQTELDQLVLSYAVTIHKSQGSEYPVVIMPMLYSFYVMLQRNLIYTGVTRAKKLLIMIGDPRAIHAGVSNNVVAKRNTLLAQRIAKNI